MGKVQGFDFSFVGALMTHGLGIPQVLLFDSCTPIGEHLSDHPRVLDQRDARTAAGLTKNEAKSTKNISRALRRFKVL